MTLPPWLLRIKVENESRHFNLWLPLFALWPFVLLAAVVMAPVVVTLAIVFWWTGWGRPMLYSGPRFFSLFCALRGLEINVKKTNERVHISFQ